MVGISILIIPQFWTFPAMSVHQGQDKLNSPDMFLPFMFCSPSFLLCLLYNLVYVIFLFPPLSTFSPDCYSSPLAAHSASVLNTPWSYLSKHSVKYYPWDLKNQSFCILYVYFVWDSLSKCVSCHLLGWPLDGGIC